MSLNLTRHVRRFWLGVSLMLCGLLVASTCTAQADWIAGFPAEPGFANESATNPDITAYYLHVNYDGAGHFTATSQWDNQNFLNNDNAPIYDIGGTSNFNLSVTVNTSTGAPISGSLTISGEASSFYTASTSGNLLTGTLSQFGFPDPAQALTDSGAENFQFIFTTTGGDLAAEYPSIAVNMSWVAANWNGDLTTAFDDDTGLAQADNFAGPPSPVPEPSTLSLLGFGALVLTSGFGFLRTSKVLRRNSN